MHISGGSTPHRCSPKTRQGLIALLALLSIGFTAGLSDAAPDDTAPAPRPRFRLIAPGIETTIPANRGEADTYSRHDIVEVLRGIENLDWTPKQSPANRTLRALASNADIRRTVWCLEFTFKPVRMISVDVPLSNGKLQRKLIWYLVYHVRNTGGHLRPERQDDGNFKIGQVDFPVTFSPLFALESHEYKKAYLDRIIPTAVEAIRQKEDPRRELLNSVEIAARPIQVSSPEDDRSVWGVATWEDVDPRIDAFSISIEGLTNAYRWADPPGAFQRGDEPGKGRVLAQKTLMLNFWRPGDTKREQEQKIYFGLPDRVDYRWIYR